MDLTKYERIFTEEAGKYLEELDRFLMEVEKDPDNLNLWGDIHGKVHSIKGMSRALSLDKITGLSHLMEDWCKAFQQGAVSASADMIQMLFNGVDILKGLVEKGGKIEDNESLGAYNGILSQFEKDPDQWTGKTGQFSGPVPAEAGRIDHVRVKYSLIEELLGLSQEIQFMEKRLPPVFKGQISMGFKNWIDHYTSMLKGLYFRLAQLRLMPVGDFADLFVKPIRDMARDYDRNIVFDVVGGDIEADLVMLERLREPFIHILRNSIAHGIESSEERIGMGKKGEGRILIEAKSEKNSIAIKISDDGRGISRSAISRYLKENRGMSGEEISGMPEEEFLWTIFNPDFSSASGTDDLAGRGIGMSVVSQTIKALGGKISLRSQETRATEFLMVLPVSLSIIYAISFRLGRYVLSIPTSKVVSIDRKKFSEIVKDKSYLDIKGILGVEGGNGEGSLHVLNLRYQADIEGEKGTVKLAVENIIGNTPLMIMPLGEILGKIDAYAGVGIMENGDISMLLDMDSILEGFPYLAFPLG